MKRRLTIVDMVERFQCPGCVVGSDTKCGSFKLTSPLSDNEHHCKSHCPGTNLLGLGQVALGLPKGFNRYGLYAGKTDLLTDAVNGNFCVRLFPEGFDQRYDKFNVPVWRYEEDGFLFVRMYSPRTNAAFVDVIQLRRDQTAEQIAGEAMNVGEFYDEID